MSIIDYDHADVDDFLADDDTDTPPDLLGEYDADKRLRAYRNLVARKARTQATFDGYLADLDQWKATQDDKVDGALAVLGGWLRNWMAVQLARNPKLTSIELPSGTLATHKANWSARVTDPAALLAWAAESHPELVDEPPPPAARVKAGDVKKVADVVWDGEVGRIRIDDEWVPGMEAVRTEGAERMGREYRSFDIKVG